MYVENTNYLLFSKTNYTCWVANGQKIAKDGNTKNCDVHKKNVRLRNCLCRKKSQNTEYLVFVIISYATIYIA